MKPILICGMHRSGTSMVANILRDCGVFLGAYEQLLGPTEDNPEGYGEAIELVQFNDRLLALFGGGWANPISLPLGWEVHPDIRIYLEEAFELSQRYSRENQLWGWKDPRLSLLLPFWKKIYPEMKVVICLRNPIEVAISLNRRVVGEMFHSMLDFRTGLSVNEKYLNELNAYVAHHADVILVHYENWFENPQKELDRLSKFLHFDLTEVMRDSIILRVKAVLRRNSYPNSLLMMLPGVSDEFQASYLRLSEKAGRRINVTTDWPELQGSVQRLLTTVLDLNQIGYQKSVKFYQQLATQDQQLIEQSRQLADRSQQLTEYGQRLAERDRQLAGRNQQLAERDQQLAERDQQLAGLAPQFVRVFRKLIEGIAPTDSLRRYLYSSIIVSIKSIISRIENAYETRRRKEDYGQVPLEVTGLEKVEAGGEHFQPVVSPPADAPKCPLRNINNIVVSEDTPNQFTPVHDTAILVHVYYPEIWAEIRSLLEKLDGEFDVYISLGETVDFPTELSITNHANVKILRMRNIGRDIAPFVYLYPRIRKMNYQYVCKLHTKKSPHRKDGVGWRRDVLRKLIGSQEQVNRIKLLLSEKRIGIVGPEGHILAARQFWGANKAKVKELASQMNISFEEEFEFVAGSMFWFKPEIFDPLSSWNADLDAFGEELGELDGTLAHALERFFGLMVSAMGAKIEPIDLPWYNRVRLLRRRWHG